MTSVRKSDEFAAIERYVRAANYLSAAQIFLRDNFLLERPIEPHDIKPRLLGHWGTAPGINLLYAHLQRLVAREKQQAIFVLGPGHGFAALQANLFMEGTLGEYYPEATHDGKGAAYVIKNFSWPGGFPSHSSPMTPGVIVEGGELGYSLATAFGAVLDNPDLLATVMVGDGEAETGPAAAAWHLPKLIDPKTNGAVLPVLHLNGYKISGPTIFGRMTRRELSELFSGYGYHPLIVEFDEARIHERLDDALRLAYKQIAKRRERGWEVPPPMIVLETPKGWTGPKRMYGERIEGNALSHQVVLHNPARDAADREALEEWLRSYRFEELFDAEKGFADDIRALIPQGDLRMGMNHRCFGGEKVCVELALPDTKPFMNESVRRGEGEASSMEAAGKYLAKVFKENDASRNFRLFSPDETYSNKLQAVFRETARAFARRIEQWDKDLAPDGRVMELLSEHSLQGMMQGYVLTGRHAVFASYEAFLQIISSMADQYIKFIRIARDIPWRGSVASLNYILTSPGWRQEHNGFSHQNPGFIDSVLQKHGCFVHVYFPPDRNSTILALERCLASRNEINLIVAGKSMEVEWLTIEEARTQLVRGLMTWDFASDEDPELVLAAAGDYLTKETLAGLDYIKERLPDVRIRFVNILELSALGIGNEECRAPFSDFEDYFTSDKPVIFNFHGYPETLKQVLFDHQAKAARFFVHGYIENGTTTTPFDMHVRNKTSRLDIAREAFGVLRERGRIDEERHASLVREIEDTLARHAGYIVEHGADMPEIAEWVWKR